METKIEIRIPGSMIWFVFNSILAIVFCDLFTKYNNGNSDTKLTNSNTVLFNAANAINNNIEIA